MDIDAQHGNTTLVPKPFDALWFPDGNVVLSTDTLLFKVHRGVLSLQSSVFKDMFAFPTGNGTQANQNGVGIEQDLYEGLPLVRMDYEKGEDMACLLRAAYERQFYRRDSSDTPLETVTRLLRLSAKYDFQHLWADVIVQISNHYPITLTKYCIVDQDRSRIFGCKRQDCHFPLLNAAFTAKADVLLPALFYAASDFAISSILDEFEAGNIGHECFKVLLIGREKLESLINAFVADLPENVCKELKGSACRSGTGRCRAGALPVDLSQIANVLDLGDLKRDEMIHECFPQLCLDCSSKCVTMIDERLEEIWDKLPKLFKCPTWDKFQDELEGLSEEP